jgi:hypothetical protein
MTMDFAKPSPSAFSYAQVGQEFEFSFKEGKDGSYVLETVVPAAGGKK